MTGNIMIIDDSAIDRKIISQVLQKRLKNINLFEFEDGININEKITVNNIHVCILDIMMPVKDGFEVLKDIKEDENLVDIPIIVCTGMAEKETIEKALLLGAYDYFSKPLSEEAMQISLPLKVKNAIEFMKRKEEIIYLSYHDKLTGIYNRRFYEEEIKRLDVKSSLPISIIMGDVNGLKLINDTFGHEKGDELLQKSATSIKNACRIEDIVARWGGDEFVVLLPRTTKEEAKQIIKKIKYMTANEKVESIRVSIALGCDTKQETDENILKILKNAEDHMYRNKIAENDSVRSNMIKTIMNKLHKENIKEEMHSKKVSELCQKIGKKMGLSEYEIRKLKVAGLLHDIGKIVLPEYICTKSGRLTKKEWDEMKRHPEIGYRIINSYHKMTELAEAILSHHERWDGTGYPKGLKGRDIPLKARIISLADSFDAMTSERPYRESFSEEEALDEIKKNSGIQFDPEICRIFVEKVLSRPWN